MFWIGAIILILILSRSGMDAGTIALWVLLYSAVAVSVDFAIFSKRR